MPMQADNDSLRLIVATLLAGVLIGVIGGCFSAALGWIDGARLSVIDLARERALPDWLAALGFSLTGAALAMLAAWLARRWDDPAFKQAFPWFASQRYWEDHVLSLREQVALMQEPPLRWHED